MHSSSWVVLKSLLHKKDPALVKVPLPFLGEKSQIRLQSAPFFERPIQSTSFDLKPLLNETHYSWFLPILQKTNSKEWPFFFALFDLKTQSKLKKKLKKNPLTARLTPAAEGYFQEKLLNHLVQEHPALLPKAYLPFSLLSPLLKLSKKQLVELIDLIALFDLVKEYSKIISRTTLQKLNTILSDKEKFFLKKYRHYQEPFPLSPLNLAQFQGNASSLKILLHKRGLMRLAKALSFQYFDLSWHLAHTLDLGRGRALLELATQQEKPRIVEVCLKGILEILPQIKNEV
ncbi:MAG: hypothetical protein WC371_04170 [Parachlamydiales bacterium]|jgi:hypothetical protein